VKEAEVNYNRRKSILYILYRGRLHLLNNPCKPKGIVGMIMPFHQLQMAYI